MNPERHLSLVLKARCSDGSRSMFDSVFFLDKVVHTTKLFSRVSREHVSIRSKLQVRDAPHAPRKGPGPGAASPDLDNSCLMGNVPHKSDAALRVFVWSLSCSN